MYIKLNDYKSFTLFLALALAVFFLSAHCVTASDTEESSEEEDEERPIRILSIDGGGVRGLIPAIMLEKLEKETNKSVVDLFDVVAGTSIGGILGLYLTVPDNSKKYPKYAASEAVDLIENKSDQIFYRSNWWATTSMGGYLGPKYDHTRLEEILKEKFHPRGLFSSCMRDTIVTSYELERKKPYIFRSWEAQRKDEFDFMTWQVGRATSAAPTYFEPTKVKNVDDQEYSFIDGGVIANNPTMQAYTEAKQRYGHSRKLVIVSLGTGGAIEKISFNQAKSWGPLGWAQPVIGITMDGVSSLVHDQISGLVKRGGADYLRLQTTLRKGEGGLDNFSKENLKNLRIRTETTIDNNEDRIEKIALKLLGKHG